MIEYRFHFEGRPPISFQIHLDRMEPDPASTGPHADWTRLGVHQCAECTLRCNASAFCPAAVDLEQIVEQFKGISSFDTVKVEVNSPQRSYSRVCDVQTGLRSLMGLVLSTSRCPWFSQLRGLAESHLPFATLEETLCRVVGNYLIREHFVTEDGWHPEVDLEGLKQLYQGMWQVNQTFKKRIALACTKDASINAMDALSMISQALSFSLQDDLAHLRSYLSEFPMAPPLRTALMTPPAPRSTRPESESESKSAAA